MAAADDPSQSRKQKCDVFLNFRGADTRKGFTDHLYTALNRAGIPTFRDDNEIDHGKEIESECLKAIEQSKFSVVILSKRYADSPWCLDELVHILRCRKEKGHQVHAVFYDVDPTDVEQQTGSFAESFKKHEKNKVDKKKQEQWKAALIEISALKGLDLRHHEDGHEARNIDNIVKDILCKLDRKKLSVAIHPVGLARRANDVINLLKLDDNSENVRMVGVYGIDGIGKTCIAKEAYNTICDKFEASWFLGNVRERAKSSKKGIAKLQRELLSEILEIKYVKINDEDEGLTLIQKRLSCKRLLLVLDDVDELNQLNKILGTDYGWLVPGSRVIITTRIENLLTPSSFYCQYKALELYPEDALELLCLHAFDQSSPPESYIDCANKAVRYTKGVPLALEVLGSLLRGKSVDVWKDKLKKLEEFGDPEIHSILEMSYDSLEDDAQKTLFLDIAFFLIGKEKDYAMSESEACKNYPTERIDALVKKRLVIIGFRNELLMHDLIRDMGRNIIRRHQHSLDLEDQKVRIGRHLLPLEHQTVKQFYPYFKIFFGALICKMVIGVLLAFIFVFVFLSMYKGMMSSLAMAWKPNAANDPFKSLGFSFE